jgi:hypothetical protein
MKSNNNNNKFSSPKIFSKKYSNIPYNTSLNNLPKTFSSNTFSSNNSSNNPSNIFSSNTSSNNPPKTFSSNTSSNNTFSSNTSSNNISSNNLNKNKIIENVDTKDNNAKLPPIKSFPTPNQQNQQNLPVYIPTPSQKVEVKTDIFEAIKTGFFISMGQRFFDGIFGNREVKVENENTSKCLELKEIYEKCIKEDNNNCKEFYEKMKEYRCKL